MHPTLTALAFVAVVVTEMALAQTGTDPISRAIPIRVVGHEDGLPRPGVEVYLRGGQAVQLDGDGFLIAEDTAVRRLRHVVRARTDPEGRAKLRSDSPLRWNQFIVAPPFLRMGEPKRVDEGWLIKVAEHAPVGVRVVDSAGKPMVNFPVALHAAGRDMQVAITDKTGRAMLGVRPDFKARAVICPAGWVGPRDAFPTVAESLAGRRSVRMVLPPYGAIRLRRVRGGVVEAGPVMAQQFSHPTEYGHLNAQIHATAKKANGVIYPFVALGIRVSSYSQFGSDTSVACEGPTQAGEVRDVDIDLGLQLSVTCLDLPEGIESLSLRARLITDVEEREVFARRQRDGRYLIEVGRAIKGEKLRRVNLDAGRYSVTLACDHALPTAAIDLGELKLVAYEPQLRGRVLDASGKPVAGARVVISPVNQRNRGYVKQSNEEGRFVSSGPVIRDPDGVPLQLYAKARLGKMVAAFVRGSEGEVALTLAPVLPSTRKPIAAKGTVVVRLVGVDDPNQARGMLKLDGRWGVGRMPKIKALPDGGTEFTFFGLRGGTYRLLATAPDHGKFVVFDNLVVPGDGQCQDSRLRDLDCSEHLRKAVVQVIDEQSVPIAGAHVMLPDSVRVTDGEGKATLYLGRTAKTVGTIQRPGMRTERRSEWPDGLVIRLEKVHQLRVRVVGLPAEVSRSKLEVWLRDEEHNRFGGPRAMLQSGDEVSLALPARGKYRLHLLVTHRTRNGSRSSTVHVDVEPVAIGDNKDLELRLELSKVEVERLRELLKRRR